MKLLLPNTTINFFSSLFIYSPPSVSSHLLCRFVSSSSFLPASSPLPGDIYCLSSTLHALVSGKRSLQRFVTEHVIETLYGASPPISSFENFSLEI